MEGQTDIEHKITHHSTQFTLLKQVEILPKTKIYK